MGYSPVEPSSHSGTYRRDCMRNTGHEDAHDPAVGGERAEPDRARSTASTSTLTTCPEAGQARPGGRQRADLHPSRARAPSIYARPGDRLHIHVFNADGMPHSFHVHGLEYGIDSDGSWPLRHAGRRRQAIGRDLPRPELDVPLRCARGNGRCVAVPRPFAAHRREREPRPLRRHRRAADGLSRAARASSCRRSSATTSRDAAASTRTTIASRRHHEHGHGDARATRTMPTPAPRQAADHEHPGRHGMPTHGSRRRARAWTRARPERPRLRASSRAQLPRGVGAARLRASAPARRRGPARAAVLPPS